MSISILFFIFHFLASLFWVLTEYVVTLYNNVVNVSLEDLLCTYRSYGDSKRPDRNPHTVDEEKVYRKIRRMPSALCRRYSGLKNPSNRITNGRMAHKIKFELRGLFCVLFSLTLKTVRKFLRTYKDGTHDERKKYVWNSWLRRQQ